MEEILFQLADELSLYMRQSQLCQVLARPMNSDEQGFSGAKLLRLDCTGADGNRTTFIAKYTDVKECQVMDTLTVQNRRHTPLTRTDQNRQGEKAWIVMEDIRSDEPIAANPGLPWKTQVAAALADIHADNFSAAKKMSLLPHADRSYWQNITSKISIDHFENACKNDHAFSKKYARLLPVLYRRGEQFVKDMTLLYQDGESLTLTHGDLQTISGDHVRCFKGKPVIIDWGFSRYAPFYIDLVDFFTKEEALIYWEALRSKGILLSKDTFEECFHRALVYPAFIYMYPALVQYRHGSEGRLEQILSVLCQDS